jgi:hypothetical protein
MSPSNVQHTILGLKLYSNTLQYLLTYANLRCYCIALLDFQACTTRIYHPANSKLSTSYFSLSHFTNIKNKVEEWVDRLFMPSSFTARIKLLCVVFNYHTKIESVLTYLSYIIYTFTCFVQHHILTNKYVYMF